MTTCNRLDDFFDERKGIARESEYSRKTISELLRFFP